MGRDYLIDMSGENFQGFSLGISSITQNEFSWPPVVINPEHCYAEVSLLTRGSSVVTKAQSDRAVTL